MEKLYFAPINVFGNYVYRHFLLGLGVDFVFSELLIVSKFHLPEQRRKFKYFPDDVSKTIFQIGVDSVDEIIKGVNYLNSKFNDLSEININMGCPQSSMQQSLLCSGVMFHPKKMAEFSKALVDECSSFNILPSVKMRLGTNPEDDDLEKYVKIIVKAGIRKIYIHTRYLRYNYSKPALYDRVKTIKIKFPEVEFIFNGDIDSRTRFDKLVSLGSSGVLIGRAALHNPLVFKQIKNNAPSRSDHYNPIENDLSISLRRGHFILSDEKKDLIKQFIKLSSTVNELTLCKKNVLYMLKGLSNRGNLSENIQNSESFEELIKYVDLCPSE